MNVEKIDLLKSIEEYRDSISQDLELLENFDRQDSTFRSVSYSAWSQHDILNNFSSRVVFY